MVNKLPLEIIFVFTLCIILGSIEDLFLSSIGVKLTTVLKFKNGILRFNKSTVCVLVGRLVLAM